MLQNNKINATFTSTLTMKIGEVSRASGVGIETLRFYERSGLLGKPARTRSGYRVYRESILERLEFVKKAQTLGFSLEEIRRIIEENKAGKCPCAKVRENVRERLKEIDERLRDLRRYRNELAATLASWDEQETEAEGNTCSLIEHSTVKIEKAIAVPVLGQRKSR